MTSPEETAVVQVVNALSELICWVESVGFSVPAIVFATVGIVPAAFHTSITTEPLVLAMMVQPVIVQLYGMLT